MAKSLMENTQMTSERKSPNLQKQLCYLPLPKSTLKNWLRKYKADKIFFQEGAVKYDMIKGLRLEFPVSFLCKFLRSLQGKTNAGVTIGYIDGRLQ